MSTPTPTDPAERGEIYIQIMQALVETQDDDALNRHHLQELDRIIRPFARMNTDELNQVLEGMHVGLQNLLQELIGRRPAH